MTASALPSVDALRHRASVRVAQLGAVIAGGAALVTVEVSGIQRFIFDVPAKNAAREVKGRSFLVALLPKVLSFRARTAAGLGPEGEVLVAAGRALLVVPRERLDAVLDALRRDARALRDGTSDALAVDVASRMLSPEALDTQGAGSFSAAHEALHTEDLRTARQRRAEGASSALWEPMAAAPTVAALDDDAPTEWAALGQRLRTSRSRICAVGVCNARSATPDAVYWSPLGISIVTGPSLDQVASQLQGPRLLLRTDGGDVEPAGEAGEERAALPLAGTWIKADGDNALDFDALAARAEGDAKLGVLRMDLDRLGGTFRDVVRGKSGADGLRDRLALSEAVNLACGPIADAATWRATAPWDVQWVLAGGDDLFLVGAWSEIIPLSRAIRDAIVPPLKGVVAALAGEQTSAELDISAGIVIAPPGVPLSHLADLAEEQVVRAKGWRGTRIDPKKKAAVSLGDIAVGWGDWTTVITVATELALAIQSRRVPRSVLRRLVDIHALWSRAERALRAGAAPETAEASKKLWLWAYELGRAGAGLSEEGERVVRRLSRLALEDVDEGDTPRKTEQKAAAWLGIVAEIAHRRTRMGGEERE